MRSESPVGAATSHSILLGTMALALGGIGELVLFSHETRWLSVITFVIAVLVGLAAWSSPAAEIFEWGNGYSAYRITEQRRAIVARRVGAFIAFLAVIGSIVAEERAPSAIFGVQGCMWIAGMAVLLLSSYGWPASAPSQFAGMSTPGIPPWTRAETSLFGALVSLSLVTHLAFLNEIPWRFHFDEIFAYIETMRFYRGPMIPVFSTTWQGTGLPTLWFVFTGLLAHITGPGLTGVRLGVALVGAVTVVPIYVLARLLWGRLAATLAGFGAAWSAVYVHYSRISIINVTTAFWWAWCFYFLLRGLRNKRPLEFVAAGLFAGTSMYTYYGTRLLPYVILAFLVYLSVFHTAAFRAIIPQLGLMGVAFFVGFGPLLGYFMQHPAIWSGRGISMLNVPPTLPDTPSRVVTDWVILSPLVERNVLSLSVIPGADTVYYSPLLLPPEAGLLVIGIGILIRHWRHPGSFLLLLWTLGVVFVGGTLVDATEIPAFARWAPAFPALYPIMAIPLVLWIRAFVASGDRWRIVVSSLMVSGLLGADAVANTYAYVVSYPPKVPPDHSMEAVEGRFIQAAPPHTHIWVVGSTWGWTSMSGPDAEMMAPPTVTVNQLFNPSRELPLPVDGRFNQSFLFYNDEYPYIPVLRNYYPGGRLSALRTPDGSLVAQSFAVSWSEALARHGVLLAISNRAHPKHSVTRHVPGVGSLPENVRLPRSASLTWSGLVYSASASAVELTATTRSANQFFVSGRRFRANVSVAVKPGWTPFLVRRRLGNGPAPRLVMLAAGGRTVEVDRYHLWPQPWGQGLTASDPEHARQLRIDPFLGASSLEPPRGLDPDRDPGALGLGPSDGRTVSLTWQGRILTRNGGYTMEIRTDADARLWIDGLPIVLTCSEAPLRGTVTQKRHVQLSSGWHTVRVNYASTGGRNGLEWFWIPPGGKEQVVPPYLLRPSGATPLEHVSRPYVRDTCHSQMPPKTRFSGRPQTPIRVVRAYSRGEARTSARVPGDS